MTWIKICGITNLEDAKAAVDSKADALGFVFYEKSPRNIDPEIVRAISEALPANTERVGVFVDTPPQQQIDIYNLARLTAIQSYPFSVSQRVESRTAFSLNLFWGPRKGYICFPMGFFLEREERIRDLVEDLARLAGENGKHGTDPLQTTVPDTIFLDAGGIHQPGGTGKTFDWAKALPIVETARKHFKVVVAGGLNPSNVGEAIATLHPFGVDVSSGVESRPGKKDVTKMRAFIDAVRAADRLQ